MRRRDYAAVLVATELHPFTKGGIGVLYGNLLKHYATDADPLLFLNVSNEDFSAVKYGKLYPNADIVNASELLRNRSVLPLAAFANTADWHHRSYVALKALQHLFADGLRSPVIEFQDFGGLGAATLLSRSLSPTLMDARICVRVHGPEAVLRRYSPRSPWRQHLPVMDLERSALDRADAVIVHVNGVLDEIEVALGLPNLRVKAVYQRPPVGLVNGLTTSPNLAAPSSWRGLPAKTRVVFASKLDAIKAPEVFLEAMHALPREKGQPVGLLIADRLPGDPAATSHLTELIESAKGHVRWVPDVTQDQRRDILASSVVVISSPFEAFCLLAYEVALLGGRPVLNSRNAAFGRKSPWADGQNCWTFDGTSENLAEVLTARMHEPLSQPLSWTPNERPYWADYSVRPSLDVSKRTSPKIVGSVSLVITNRDLAQFADECFESVLTQTRRPERVVVVHDASSDGDVLAASVDILRRAGLCVDFVERKAPLGLASCRNIGLRHVQEDYVAFVDIDDRLDPRFIERAAGALDRDDDVDVVVPFVACFVDRADYMLGFSQHILTFIGNAHFSRYVSNISSSATCLIRRSCIPPEPFDTQIKVYEDWDLWCLLDESSRVFAVDHEIGLWYRQRPDSMSALARGTITEIYARDRVRSNAWKRGAGMVPAVVLTDATPTSAVVDQTPTAEASVVEAAAQGVLDELARLQAVEREVGLIVNRRAVRLAIALAGLRHSAATRRRLRRESVLTLEAVDKGPAANIEYK